MFIIVSVTKYLLLVFDDIVIENCIINNVYLK